jgi:radical SAM-linked protein
MISTVETSPIRDRYRIRFAKTGLLRWIGHRDLQRLWERILRRSGVRLSMSQGFHPKPRINFPSALALGVEGTDEVIEVELAQAITADELRKRLIDDDQPGLEIGTVQLVAQANVGRTGVSTLSGFLKAKLHSSFYEIELPESFIDNDAELARVDEAIQWLKGQTLLRCDRNGKQVVAHVATTFPFFVRQDQAIRFAQVDNDGATLKPVEILDAIGLGGLIDLGAIIRRTKVVLVDEPEPDYCEPIQNLTKNLFKERVI